MDRHQHTIKHVGQNIRRLRVQSCRTVKDVANELGLSVSSLSKIESGFIDIRLSRLQQIADFYGVNLVRLWILDYESNKAADIELSTAEERIAELEAQVASFQGKIILLYEKLRAQAVDYKAVHA
jgi:transcriptional regulator with XRE-family HTH domain